MSEMNEKLLKMKTERNMVFRTWLAWRQRARLLMMRREHYRSTLSRMCRAIRDSENRMKGFCMSNFKLNATNKETKAMLLHSLLMKKAWKEVRIVICGGVNNWE